MLAIRQTGASAIVELRFGMQLTESEADVHIVYFSEMILIGRQSMKATSVKCYTHECKLDLHSRVFNERLARNQMS